MKKHETSSTDYSAWGCFPAIVSILFFWALIFGVTYNGRHYTINCSCERGVVIE